MTQQTLQLDTLYKIKMGVGSVGSNNRYPRMWVSNDSIDIYVSDSATQPTTTNEPEMTLSYEDASGDNNLEFYPRYIALRQNTGVTSEIRVTDFEIEEELGVI